MSAHSPELRPPARRTGLWIAGVVICLALFFGVYEFFVRTYPGQLMDVAMRASTSEFWHPLPALDSSNDWIAFYIIAPPALVFLIIMIAGQKYTAAVIALATVLGANVATQLLKHWWLDRPALIPDGTTANALPSGHTTIAASVAVAVFLIASPRQRPFIGLLSAFWAGGWGAYIFVESWHRPSDMVAAYLVVAVAGLIGGWLIMRIHPRDNSVPFDRLPSSFGAAALCWFIGILFSLIAVVCLFLGGGWNGLENTIAEQPSLWHWVAGITMSFAPAFLTAAAGIMLFQRETGRRGHGAAAPNVSTLSQAYPIPADIQHLYDRV